MLFRSNQLLDYDLASNVGNWQRITGCGVDSIPYYKLYNPEEQARKYDSQGLYQQKWLDNNYSETTKPMINLKEAKRSMMKAYREVNLLQADDMD